MNWNLTDEEKKCFARFQEQSLLEKKPMVLWGWKRDKIVDSVRLPESRTVYFSADLSCEGSEVYISREYFFLGNRAKRDEIDYVQKQVGKSRKIDKRTISISVTDDPKFEGYSRFKMEVGTPNEYDLLAVERRLKGQPRLYIPPPQLVPEATDHDLSKYAPFALCVGSGLSAESGLPLLGSIHNLFEVDNMETRELVFGAKDGLPLRIVKSVEKEFHDFCQFSIDAVKAKPSNSHKLLSDLYKSGIVKQVFTDNMDDVLSKVNIPYTKTRLSIFPDRYPTQFDPSVKSLLVVGVAVDRRDVIKQARRAGLKIISINPVFGVAPHSRNMDYLRTGDILFKEKAYEALPKIIHESGFNKSVNPKTVANEYLLFE